MNRIPVAGPSITEKEISYVTDAVTNAWYENANIYNQRFEQAFAEYIGVEYAISLPSCTSAIHLSLLALGVGEGDEVIVPDATWIASAAPISYTGAIPVFADIDPQSWCLSADSFRDCITEKTKAVIPVNLYGGMPDMDAIRQVAQEYNVAIIEDAAESIGSEYKGRRAGSFGDTGVFSFHGSKTLTTGEGGMLVTNHRSIYDRALKLRDHGRKPGDKMFFNEEVAYKYKMSSLQAALGLAQLERIEELIDRKREIFSWYAEELKDFKGIQLNVEPPEIKNSYWMVTIILDSSFALEKHELMELLSQKNIDSRPFFHPLSTIPAYQGTLQAKEARRLNKTSYKISQYGVNLPSALNLTKEQVRFVCDSLQEILRKCNSFKTTV